MSSPSKPSQVPEKDVLCNLVEKYNPDYRKIESYLSSSDYTRETKVEWILYPRNNSRKSLFHTMCKVNCPNYIVTLIVDILGGEYLGSQICTDLLSTKTFKTSTDGRETKLIFMFQKIMEKLSHLPEVKFQLLERAIVNKAFPESTRLLLQHTQSIPLTKVYNIEILHRNKWTNSLKLLESSFKEKVPFENVEDKVREFHNATFLEIAFHKQSYSELLLKLIEIGKKDLIMLSQRSLLDAALSEYPNLFFSYAIVERLLHYGGHDLVMIEKRWRNCNKSKMNVFHLLSEKKEHILMEKSDIVSIANIMKMLLDKGGYDLIMKTNEKGQSILHTSAYFEHEECLPIVKRIINLGRENLLKIRDDKGNTILHQLSREQSISAECWKSLAFNKEINVTRNNDGKTALDLAYENNTQNCIDVLGPIIAKEGFERQDNISSSLNLSRINPSIGTHPQPVLFRFTPNSIWWPSLASTSKLELIQKKDPDVLKLKIKMLKSKKRIEKDESLKGKELIYISTFNALDHPENNEVLHVITKEQQKDLLCNFFDERFVYEDEDGPRGKAVELALEWTDDPVSVAQAAITNVPKQSSNSSNDADAARIKTEGEERERLRIEAAEEAARIKKEFMGFKKSTLTRNVHYFETEDDIKDHAHETYGWVGPVDKPYSPGKRSTHRRNDEEDLKSMSFTPATLINSPRKDNELTPKKQNEKCITTATQQSLQAEIEKLKKQLIGEEKRGQHEIETLKKLHEESLIALERKEIEIRRLQEVEKAMAKDLNDQNKLLRSLNLNDSSRLKQVKVLKKHISVDYARLRKVISGYKKVSLLKMK